MSRISIRGGDDDVRLPARVSVRFVDGSATSATLAAGASRDVVITWLPVDGPHALQAFGHVIVTSDDEAQGEAAMGFRANLPTGLGWVAAHELSALVVVPLLVPLWIMIRRFAGKRTAAPVRRVFAATAAAEVAIALATVERFVPGIGRADGNDGLQAIERYVWVRSLGAEYFVGVDGISVLFVLLVAMLSLVAAAIPSTARTKDTYWAALALLVSSVMLVFVAMDVVLLLTAWGLAILSLTMVVASAGTPAAERSAAKAALTGTLGTIALLMTFVALSLASGHAFLVDGTAVDHSLSIPELGRTNLTGVAPILGVPFVAWVWGFLLVAVAAMTPIVPLHGWLPDAIEGAPPGAGVLVAGVVVTLGPYVLVRVGLQAMPDGAGWASASMAALGAIQVVYGSCCALAQRHLRRFAAYATMAHAGAVVFSAGALSAKGVSGMAFGTFAHGLAMAALLGAVAAVENRRGGSDLRDLRSLAHEAPALAVLLGVSLAASLGVPGVACFWPVLLSLLAGFARHPSLALVVAAGWVASAAAHGRILRALVARPVASGQGDTGGDRGGPQDALLVDERRSPTHRAAHARGLTVVALVPLIMLSILFGLWPAPILGIGAAAASDISGAIELPSGSPGEHP